MLRKSHGKGFVMGKLKQGEKFIILMLLLVITFYSLMLFVIWSF